MHFVRIVETLNEPLLTLMKKYLLWICTAAALLAAGASCSDDSEVDSVGRVGIQQESLTADGAGEDLTLNVTSNAYWRINFTDPETGESIRWVTASETSGMGNTAVTLKVARNRSTSARSTYVNVITESESSAVSVLLSQGAGTIGGGDGYDFPISQTFAIDAALALDNAFIEGAVCYFDDGMILRRTGSPTVMEFSTKTHTNPTTNWYFQRGVVIGEWETGDALQLEIPVKEELSGPRVPGMPGSSSGAPTVRAGRSSTALAPAEFRTPSGRRSTSPFRPTRRFRPAASSGFATAAPTAPRRAPRPRTRPLLIRVRSASRRPRPSLRRFRRWTTTKWSSRPVSTT